MSTRRSSKLTDTKMEKLSEDDDFIESDESKPKAARLTRSKARSPSPSASSIILCSSVTSVESTSTVATLVVKTRGKKSKKIEQDKQMLKTIKVDEEAKETGNSPTSSIASVNASASSRVARRSTRVKKEEVEEERRDRKKTLRIKFYGLSLIQEINVWFRLDNLKSDIRSFIFDNNSKSHSLKSLEVSKKN
ncbi:hypothetical protein BpHYR1_006967 [Brachionus plicatilis]|uniref:Uncharacterized protein n=1 Tax=Brachionus plicatilis TaxID=10195 RepID=A0A3M7PDB6_BRAPC|nr:hypothetical protein BpHYR1_006967 [Brachionus plicatilis]